MGIPDVSYLASDGSPTAIFDSIGFECFYNWLPVFGTSVGTPQWAAMVAIINSMRANPLSSISFGTSNLLYNIAATSCSANYRDITVGSNASCGSVCTAGPGYDLVTGLGKPCRKKSHRYDGKSKGLAKVPLNPYSSPRTRALKSTQ